MRSAASSCRQRSRDMYAPTAACPAVTTLRIGLNLFARIVVERQAGLRIESTRPAASQITLCDPIHCAEIFKAVFVQLTQRQGDRFQTGPSSQTHPRPSHVRSTRMRASACLLSAVREAIQAIVASVDSTELEPRAGAIRRDLGRGPCTTRPPQAR
jgi:hypothetical protein